MEQILGLSDWLVVTALTWVILFWILHWVCPKKLSFSSLPPQVSSCDPWDRRVCAHFSFVLFFSRLFLYVSHFSKTNWRSFRCDSQPHFALSGMICPYVTRISAWSRQHYLVASWMPHPSSHQSVTALLLPPSTGSPVAILQVYDPSHQPNYFHTRLVRIFLTSQNALST